MRGLPHSHRRHSGPRRSTRSCRSAPRRNADRDVGDQPRRALSDPPSDSDESRRGETILDEEERGSGTVVNNEIEETTAGRASTPIPTIPLKVGLQVLHETFGKGVITKMGEGSLHGMNKVEMEYFSRTEKKRKRTWVNKTSVVVQVRIARICACGEHAFHISSPSSQCTSCVPQVQVDSLEEEEAEEVDASVEHSGPLLAAHERARQMKVKPPPMGARSAAPPGSRKTPEPSRDTALERLKKHPHEQLEALKRHVFFVFRSVAESNRNCPRAARAPTLARAVS